MATERATLIPMTVRFPRKRLSKPFRFGLRYYSAGQWWAMRVYREADDVVRDFIRLALEPSVLAIRLYRGDGPRSVTAFTTVAWGDVGEVI